MSKEEFVAEIYKDNGMELVKWGDSIPIVIP